MILNQEEKDELDAKLIRAYQHTLGSPGTRTAYQKMVLQDLERQARQPNHPLGQPLNQLQGNLNEGGRMAIQNLIDLANAPNPNRLKKPQH